MGPTYIKYEETLPSCLSCKWPRRETTWKSKTLRQFLFGLNHGSSTQSVTPLSVVSPDNAFQRSGWDFPPCESGKVRCLPDCSDLRLGLTGAETFCGKWSLPDVALNALNILCVPVTRQMVPATLPGIRSKHVISRASSGRGLDQSVLPFIPERHTRIAAGLETPKSIQMREESRGGRENKRWRRARGQKAKVNGGKSAAHTCVLSSLPYFWQQGLKTERLSRLLTHPSSRTGAMDLVQAASWNIYSHISPNTLVTVSVTWVPQNTGILMGKDIKALISVPSVLYKAPNK